MAYNPYTGTFGNFTINPYQVGTQPQQIQNGGFIPTPSEGYARNYPVAPGNTVIFKDENAPYIYIKTKSLNPMEDPTFDKYRMEKEELNTMPAVADKQPASFVSQQEFEELKTQVMMLRKSVDMFTDKEIENAE